MPPPTNTNPSMHDVYSGGLPQTFKHQERIKMPIFSGDKESYGTWKAAFTLCTDNMPITVELKLLILKQCLRGTPLNSIEAYGYSAAVYQATLQCLERKYCRDMTVLGEVTDTCRRHAYALQFMRLVDYYCTYRHIATRN